MYVVMCARSHTKLAVLGFPSDFGRMPARHAVLSKAAERKVALDCRWPDMVRSHVYEHCHEVFQLPARCLATQPCHWCKSIVLSVDHGKVTLALQTAGDTPRTCSSSSVMFSPSSLAIRLRFWKEILPVSSSSNKRNACSRWRLLTLLLRDICALLYVGCPLQCNVHDQGA